MRDMRWGCGVWEGGRGRGERGKGGRGEGGGGRIRKANSKVVGWDTGNVLHGAFDEMIGGKTAASSGEAGRRCSGLANTQGG